MKYIRTKDAYGKEIIALFDDRPVEKGGNVLKFSQKSIVLRKGIVIKRADFDNSKQADTIEELCDQFVYVTNNGNHYVKNNHEAIHYFIGEERPVSYYGAIWTEWGLKFVAKLSDEGKLELL